MPGSRKSSRQFNFKSPKELIELDEPLKFDAYEEFLSSDVAQIRKYIIEEAKAVQQQRENDVSYYSQVEGDTPNEWILSFHIFVLNI